MRVTETTKHNAVQSNLNKTSEKLQDLLIGVSNGKTLNKPSDDPVGAAKVQDFRTSISNSRNIEKNISANKVYLSSSEETAAQIIETLMHVKNLALDGANGASTQEHRESLANEIDLITRDLIDLGNKREGKLYVFSGTKTLTKPLEMQPQVKNAKVDFLGTQIKSREKFIPLDQDKPLPGLKPGYFLIEFADPKNPVPEDAEVQLFYPYGPEEDPIEIKQNQILIQLAGSESLSDIIKKINDTAILKENYTEDPHSRTGYKASIFAEIANDNSVYLHPETDIAVRFGPDTTGFFDQMKFGVIGNSSGYTYIDSNDEDEIKTLPQLNDRALDADVLKAQFNGYSKNEYLVKVIKGGGFGVAQISVSEDGGETWSKAALLQKQNEIFNPDGKASDKVRLFFNIPENTYFSEGLQFEFDGNEFVTYNGNDHIKHVLIDNGIKVALNINAKQLFYEEPGNEASVNVFDMMNRLKQALVEDDEMSVQKSIFEVEAAIEQVLDKRSQIGSTFKEFEASEDRIDSSIDFKMEELSKLEDMDLAKGAVDLNSAELKHKVALDSAARLIQPTLINFLK